MQILLVATHIIVSLALIMIVLLQTGKGADMGAAFGGGASQTLFGTTGASTFLGKATTIVAVMFMVTCLGLAYVSTGGKGTSSIMKDGEQPVLPVSSPADTADVQTETTAPVAETAADAAQPEAATPAAQPEAATPAAQPEAATPAAQPEAATPDAQPAVSPTAEQPE